MLALVRVAVMAACIISMWCGNMLAIKIAITCMYCLLEIIIVLLNKVVDIRGDIDE